MESCKREPIDSDVCLLPHPNGWTICHLLDAPSPAILPRFSSLSLSLKPNCTF